MLTALKMCLQSGLSFSCHAQPLVAWIWTGHSKSEFLGVAS